MGDKVHLSVSIVPLNNYASQGTLGPPNSRFAVIGIICVARGLIGNICWRQLRISILYVTPHFLQWAFTKIEIV